MAFIALLARFLGRPSDALRWLFIAGFVMLAWNPLLLFYDPSFQLSFMAALGLILFSQTIFNFISSKNKIAKLIPIKLGIREIVSSTLAVQIFVLPLLVKMSGFISIISFLINPIILPLVPWVMALGAITGALGIIPFIGTILSWPFGAISYLISQIIISATEFSSSIPFATFQTGSISFWIIILWYAIYGFIFWKIRKNITPNPLLP
jgi:competence protein ComEC